MERPSSAPESRRNTPGPGGTGTPAAVSTLRPDVSTSREPGAAYAANAGPATSKSRASGGRIVLGLTTGRGKATASRGTPAGGGFAGVTTQTRRPSDTGQGLGLGNALLTTAQVGVTTQHAAGVSGQQSSSLLGLFAVGTSAAVRRPLAEGRVSLSGAAEAHSALSLEPSAAGGLPLAATVAAAVPPQRSVARPSSATARVPAAHAQRRDEQGERVAVPGAPPSSVAQHVIAAGSAAPRPAAGDPGSAGSRPASTAGPSKGAGPARSAGTDVAGPSEPKPALRKPGVPGRPPAAKKAKAGAKARPAGKAAGGGKSSKARPPSAVEPAASADSNGEAPSSSAPGAAPTAKEPAAATASSSESPAGLGAMGLARGQLALSVIPEEGSSAAGSSAATGASGGLAAAAAAAVAAAGGAPAPGSPGPAALPSLQGERAGAEASAAASGRAGRPRRPPPGELDSSDFELGKVLGAGSFGERRGVPVLVATSEQGCPSGRRPRRSLLVPDAGCAVHMPGPLQTPHGDEHTAPRHFVEPHPARPALASPPRSHRVHRSPAVGAGTGGGQVLGPEA
jgi:hypothetical protein